MFCNSRKSLLLLTTKNIQETLWWHIKILSDLNLRTMAVNNGLTKSDLYQKLGTELYLKHTCLNTTGDKNYSTQRGSANLKKRVYRIHFKCLMTVVLNQPCLAILFVNQISECDIAVTRTLVNSTYLHPHYVYELRRPYVTKLCPSPHSNFWRSNWNRRS